MHMRSFVAASALLLPVLGCRDEAASPLEPVPTPYRVAALSGSWVTRAEMPRWRQQHATVTLTNAAGQSVLYVIGGRTIRGALHPATNQAYNVATNRWTTAARQPRSYYQGNGAGVIKGKIYISGGFHPSTDVAFASSALYMYDPDGDTWVEKHSMPSGGMRGVTGVIGDRLYVLTGCPLASDCNGDPPLAFFRYDPSTDQWASLPAPPSYHRFGMAGVIGGKLYVVGGEGEAGYSSRQLDVYDPVANQWTTKAPMPQGREWAAGVALGGKLYVIGGMVANPDSVITVRTTAVYDPATDTWTRQAPLPTAPGFVAGSRVVLDGRARIEVVSGHSNLQYSR